MMAKVSFRRSHGGQWHPLLGPRIERLHDRARERNTTLPDTLEKLIDEGISGERGANSKGLVK